jgi:hypothetical protein
VVSKTIHLGIWLKKEQELWLLNLLTDLVKEKNLVRNYLHQMAEKKQEINKETNYR